MTRILPYLQGGFEVNGNRAGSEVLTFRMTNRMTNRLSRETNHSRAVLGPTLSREAA